ncbi:MULTISPECIES: potassium transporter TrkG [unclassified Streptococcus]|uniref:TrkH family potassium uptake protein n=1 Tax=unclassified Streptococcus TaxID=2608887 RepID=UPI0018A8B59C|nr:MULTISPECIES: potassium transporter TrkG [unclassified Streptococcus]MBF8970032.1 TrkH family potassium uptake protein [Streptococcus sp. NLN76]MBG9367252.1 TrkH family potassium uptake protein [Streptococcus sp. NLN64]MBJ6746512.1 TrkH family potassium uptake protein [Streptococcus sp. 121]
MYRFLSKQPPARRIFISFALVSFIGSLALSLPMVQTPYSMATYFDHLFMAVSMVCVTGLSVVPLSETYNIWGQIIAMILIQIGGLGFISFIGLFYMRSQQKLSYSNRAAIQESTSYSQPQSMKSFLKSVFLITFLLEGIGTFLLSFRFVPLLGFWDGLFTSLFLSVSAFCNAGFDNLGRSSLIQYQIDPLVILTISFLIITGGLGFSVWFDLRTNWREKHRFKRLRFHTKVVLLYNLLLLAIGTITTLITEYNNPAILGEYDFGNSLLVAFFQSVTVRTAGFSTVDFTQMRPSTIIVLVHQMFIGGAPGGTAGGIKITTFLVLLAFARSEILGLPHVNFWKRTISPKTVQKSFIILMVYFVALMSSLALLSYFDGDSHRFLYVMMEAVSALSTVGVSANLTSSLNHACLTIIMLLMFMGRIGPLTLLISFADHTPSRKSTLKYAKANLLVG